VTTDSPTADPHLQALRSSADRLRAIVAPLEDDRLESAAYPTGWSIADVLSHIGSGAVIQQRRLDDALADRPTPDDFAPAVWDTWNTKPARARADDALLADQALIERLDSLPGTDRARLRLPMGPMTFDFAEFVGLRLNEHVFHTWDVEVALDPAATLPPEPAGLVVDRLELVARYTARPAGTTRVITVRTTAPVRRFTIDLRSDTVTFSPEETARAHDVELPAEAFARLVYGRLDPDRPLAVGGDRTALEALRRAFPGP
jgi:uncharacterized protein (TIGR03083 family)